MMNKVVEAMRCSVLPYLFAYWSNLFALHSVCDTNGSTTFKVIQVVKFVMILPARFTPTNEMTNDCLALEIGS